MTVFRRAFRWNQTLTLIALALIIALAEWAALGRSWGAVGFAIVANLALVGSAQVYATAAAARQEESVLSRVDALCSVSPAEVSTRAEEFRPLAGDESLAGQIVSRVLAYLARCGQSIHESEQHRASAEIRARRAGSQLEHLLEILDGLDAPVIAIDQYDELLFANSAAAELFPQIRNDALPKGLNQRQVAPQLAELLADTRRRRAPTQRSTDWQLAPPGAELCDYRVMCRNIFSSPTGSKRDSSVPSGAVAVLTDITAQRLIQKRNAEFVSAASHEMKTPLSGIKAYVELLEDGAATDEATRDEFLEVISSQADRLQRLIDNLLNLARIEAGVVQVNKLQLSLNEVLEEAVGIVSPVAEQKSIQVVCELSRLYLGILADRDMLLQAAINLLSNAVKYTETGGRVILRSRLVDQEVTFEVEDSGVGLSPEDCDRIFDKFYRVKQHSGMASGTGLGLPLAKHIVEDVHGGRLTVSSVLAKGSTFTVRLPSCQTLCRESAAAVPRPA